jgi:hypothetical protein
MKEIQAKVAMVIDSSLLAFNAGSDRGVAEGDIVTLWQEVDIYDPDDPSKVLGGIKLGKLSLKVRHVQESLSVAYVTDPIESDEPVNILAAWQRRKRITSSTNESDVNKIYVKVGEEATIYHEDAPVSKS